MAVTSASGARNIVLREGMYTFLDGCQLARSCGGQKLA